MRVPRCCPTLPHPPHTPQGTYTRTAHVIIGIVVLAGMFLQACVGLLKVPSS